LKHSLGISRLVYFLRCAPTWKELPLLLQYDKLLKCTNSYIAIDMEFEENQPNHDIKTAPFLTNADLPSIYPNISPNFERISNGQTHTYPIEELNQLDFKIFPGIFHHWI